MSNRDFGVKVIELQEQLTFASVFCLCIVRQRLPFVYKFCVGQEHVKMIWMKFDRFQESVTNMNGKSEFHFLGRILSKNISRNAYNP